VTVTVKNYGEDPKDDMLLELAIKSRSKYIVTYNTHNFAGAERFDILIVTAAEFLPNRRVFI